MTLFSYLGANKSIQALIYRYMTASGSKRYIDALPQLVQTYNERKHHSTGLSPSELERDLATNASIARSNLEVHYSDVFRRARKRKLRYSVGDKVRLLHKAGRFSRSYKKRFSDEVFRIIFVDTRQPTPMYRLQSVVSGRIVRGDQYANYLTKVIDDDDVDEAEDSDE